MGPAAAEQLRDRRAPGPSLAGRRSVQALWTGGDEVPVEIRPDSSGEERRRGVEVASGGKTC